MGIIIGVLAAVNRGRAFDLIGMVIAIAGISQAPNFWLGLQLMQIFAVNLTGYLPTGGLESWEGLHPAFHRHGRGHHVYSGARDALFDD